MDAVKVVKEIRKRVNREYISNDLIEYLQEVNAIYPGKLKPMAKGVSFNGIQTHRLIQSILDSEKTFSYTVIYRFFMPVPESLTVDASFSIADNLPKNVTDIKLVKVIGAEGDVTKHFELRKDGSKFILNFDRKMIYETILKSDISFDVAIEQTISLEVPSSV